MEKYPLEVYLRFYANSQGKPFATVKDTRRTKVYWIRNFIDKENIVKLMWKDGYSFVREDSAEIHGNYQFIVEFRKKNFINKSQYYMKYLNQREFNRKVNMWFLNSFIIFLLILTFYGRAVLFDKSFSMHYTLTEELDVIEENYGYDLEIVGSGHNVFKYYVKLERDLPNGDKEYYIGYIKNSHLDKIVKTDSKYEIEKPKMILWKN